MRGVGSTILLLGMIFLAIVSGCRSSGSERDEEKEASLEPHEYVELVMASPVIIRVYAASEAHARRTAREAFDRMHALERTLSDWIEDSESNLLEAAAPASIPISDDLRDAIAVSRSISRDTDGMFDPTIGPLVELWRRTRNSGFMPSEEELRLARGRVDLDSIELDSDGARITRRDVELDFGAIGKGIALDAASRILDARGLRHHLINFDGEILVGDSPPEKTSWEITILPSDSEDPIVIDAVRCAVATSGGVNQFVEIDGVRYSHVIDPSTGLGVDCARQVTVICSRATHADALATVGCILPTKRFEEMLRARFEEVSAVVLENDGGSLTVTRIGDPPVQAPAVP